MWKFRAPKADRLDRLLRGETFPGSEWFSRSVFEQLVENGQVLVAGKRVKKAGAEVPAGAEVELQFPDQLGLLMAETPAELVWVDPARQLAVFQKQVGVSSYPLLPWERDTFANQVCTYLESNGWMPAADFAALAEPPRLEGGLVQRLDRDTSGLLMVALNPRLKERLHQALITGKIRKTYLALTSGIPKSGEHRFRLAYAPGGKVKAHPDPEGSAVKVQILKEKGGCAMVEVVTNHGARHIVRATLAALGAPLVGDRDYGGNSELAAFHQLHATRLELLDNSLFPAFPGNVEAFPPQSFLDCARRLGVH